MNKQLNIGVLISGGGSNLQAIIDACRKKEINGKLCFVGSDNPDAKGLQRAEKHGIPTFVVDYKAILKDKIKSLPPDFNLKNILKKQRILSSQISRDKINRFFETRAVAESLLVKKMMPYPFDILVLAGFMRVLTPYFIDRVNIDPGKPRIMNIHPALLPSFPGVDGYGDTYRYGCKVGGCTVHFVDYGEDTGAIIGQKAFEIFPQDSLEDVCEKGLALEWQLYPQCINLFAENRIEIIKNTYKTKNGEQKTRNVVNIL
ncbi:MAG: phosphoribosylglycinamide formyltransferase [Desulfobacterales bacterium]